VKGFISRADPGRWCLPALETFLPGDTWWILLT
jgi:hypothetical protein